MIFANILALSLYAFLHIIFYDLPFVPQDELLIILKILGLVTGTAVGISFILFAGDALRYFIRHRKQFRFPAMLHFPEPSPNSNNGA